MATKADLRLRCEHDHSSLGELSDRERDLLWEYVYSNTKGESPMTISVFYGATLSLCFKMKGIWQ